MNAMIATMIERERSGAIAFILALPQQRLFDAMMAGGSTMAEARQGTERRERGNVGVMAELHWIAFGVLIASGQRQAHAIE